MNISNRKRKVPLSLSIQLIFGGFINQFGWAFFGFGMIFAWIFVGNSDFSFIYYWGGTEKVMGTAIESNETGAEVNEEEVLETYYKFTALDGQEYQDVCYATGMGFYENSPVEVEYPEGRPDLARIVGTRRAMFGPWTIFVMLFPLVGFIFIYFGLTKGIKAYFLMRTGILTYGTLISKEPTGASVNEDPVYKMTFQFTDEMSGRKYTAFDKTHEPEELEDDPEEAIFYSQKNPEYAILLNSLPGYPELDDNDQFVNPSIKGALMVLPLPLLSIIGNGLYIWAKIS